VASRNKGSKTLIVDGPVVVVVVLLLKGITKLIMLTKSHLLS
jgi:hypothetical protein